ncbi:MAG: hypothetical protein KDB80_04990 [Planctomycetes bacterium]|nr:hypothetical protein [Planctomycetota bacterium]
MSVGRFDTASTTPPATDASNPSEHSTNDETERTVVKAERWTHAFVVRSAGGGAPTFIKRYLVPAWDAWRFVFGHARAARELAAMRAMRSAGLPCVEPTGYAEERSPWFRLRWSEIRWVFEAGSDLGHALPDADPTERRRLCREVGALLARIHDAGFLWGTAVPRNIIVTASRDPALKLCDVPYAVRFDASIHGSRMALIDLFTAAGSRSRRRDFSRGERRRILLAYTRGDRVACRRVMRKLDRRSQLGHRTIRGLLRLLTSMRLPIPCLRVLRAR